LKKKIIIIVVVALLAVTTFALHMHSKSTDKTLTLVNVSYDPTRELYEEYNELFKAYYLETYGEEIEVVQSHGGSGTQVRSVIEGSDADVVTLALEHDVSLLEKVNLLSDGWVDRLPGESSPYTSTIVFLVRKGNEKNIQDWSDLVRDDVNVITPDPKSSGGACWNFLAAWYYADKTYDGDEAKIKEYMTALYENVSVMDSGARSATTTFVENGQGDVLIAWENEAIATLKEYPDQYEIVNPSVSILTQPSVAVVDAIAEKNGTTEAAEAYLSYLYSDEAQELIASCGYRPYNEKILAEYADTFDLNMELCTIEDFGGWDMAYEKFFDDGAIFDEIYGN
jgi:sulfate transport system substrate-binding protein